ncbi:MAG: hypothetical protein B6I20_02335 [Bacteroidetes bacterium 4572_117]|nr:MAG: hypothetical protein B6I20_02335 [Bacteroidetes bacterium 4572_117]
MQTAEIKLEIFRYIDSLETSKLNSIYNLLISNRQKQGSDFWEALNEWEKNDIELGLVDLENGKKQNFDEFMQKYQ